MLRYRHENYILISKYPIEAPSSLIESIFSDTNIGRLGRGEVSFLKLDGKNLALKKYTHGGIFRIVTSDLYISEKRLINEAKILEYLGDNGVLCPKFFLGIIEKSKIFKRLFLVTERLDGFKPLLEVLGESKGLVRLKHLYRVALLVSQLSKLNVYHPDFHLRNILSGPRGILAVIDFDRAEIRDSKGIGIKKMVFRFLRYVEKIESKKGPYLKEEEKLFFLRAIESLTGLRLSQRFLGGLRLRKFHYKISWFFESLIYGGKS